MKKFLLTFGFILAALMPVTALAVTPLVQSQLIIPPLGNGLIISSTTANGGYLEASSSPSIKSIFATSTTATSSIVHLSTAQLAIGSLSGFLKATAGYVATALINLTADVTGILPYANGGTGTSTAVSGQLRGMGTAADYGVATTTVTCTGSASCTTFVAIGPSPITINASGGSGGSGSVSTSTNEVSGQVATFSSNSATPALIAGNTNFTFVSPLLTVTQASTTKFSTGLLFAGLTGTTTINGTGDLFVAGSTTLQNFTGRNATTSQATTTSLAVTGVTSALHLANGTGGVIAYGGASACASSNFVTTISAVGATTCGTATISGVNLGSNLNSFSVGTDFTGTSYNGSASVSDWAIKMSQAHTWTALQQFGAAASSTQFSAGLAYFGLTATSTFNGVGDLFVAGSTTLQNFTARNSTTTNATTTSLAITGGASNCNGTSALTTTSTGVVNCTAQPQGTVTAIGVTTNQGVSGSSSGGATPNLTITLGALTGVTSFNGLVITANTGTITTGVWNGTTIAVANGGTGTGTTFTQGSVVFAGASGIYTQNNANFFWDNSRVAHGIGTTTPSYILTVASSTAPQIALSDALGSNLWTMRNVNANFYLATSTFNSTSTNAIISITPSATANATTTFSLTDWVLKQTSQTALSIFDAFNTEVLRVNTASTTGSIFTVAATTSPSLSSPIKLFDVDQYGHLMASSTGPAAPVLTNCAQGGGSATLTAGSNDTIGSFTTGTLATACTITFTRALPFTPAVFIEDNSTAATIDVSAQSTTAFTVSISTGISGAKIYYFVVQGPSNL